jgi:hypothetical protein
VTEQAREGGRLRFEQVWVMKCKKYIFIINNLSNYVM